MSFPKSIGACIDQLYKLRQQRLEIEKSADEVKQEENALEKHILDSFSKTDLDGAKGKLATAGINRSTVPNVQDWDAFYAYIKQNDAFDMLQRRVSSTAYRERLDNEEVVPGVETYEVIKLSLRKR